MSNPDDFNTPAPAEPPPLDFGPMEPLDGPPPPPGDHRWVYCAQVPGERIVIHVHGALSSIGVLPAVRIVTTGGHDMSGLFPEFDALADGPENRPFSIEAMLRISGNDGGSDTMAYRLAADGPEDATARAIEAPANLVVRDLMHFDGHRIADQPYAARRFLLGAALPAGDSWTILPDHLDPASALIAGQDIAVSVPQLLSRRLDSHYFASTSNASWIRTAFPALRITDVVGWIDDRPLIGRHTDALLVAGPPGNNRVRPVQPVRLGLTLAARSELATTLRQLPTSHVPAGLRCEGDLPMGSLLRWARPGIRATVIGTSLQPDGLIDHPVLLDIRIGR